MGRKAGDLNKFVMAENPTRFVWKLRKSRCSEDLFEERYRDGVVSTLDIPDEDEVRKWVNDNHGYFSKSHLAYTIDVTPKYFDRWLNRAEFSLNYSKVVKLVKYIKSYNHRCPNIYVPEEKELTSMMKQMVKDGFVWASASHIAWYFRSDPDKLEAWFDGNLQFMVSYKRVKKYTKYVLDEYFRAFRTVEMGRSDILFIEGL